GVDRYVGGAPRRRAGPGGVDAAAVQRGVALDGRSTGHAVVSDDAAVSPAGAGGLGERGPRDRRRAGNLQSVTAASAGSCGGGACGFFPSRMQLTFMSPITLMAVRQRSRNQSTGRSSAM